MIRFSPPQGLNARLVHIIILTRWKVWIFPLICFTPYCLSIILFFREGQFWLAYVLLSPVLMLVTLGVMTLYLAVLEFKGKNAGRIRNILPSLLQLFSRYGNP